MEEEYHWDRVMKPQSPVFLFCQLSLDPDVKFVATAPALCLTIMMIIDQPSISVTKLQLNGFFSRNCLCHGTRTMTKTYVKIRSHSSRSGMLSEAII